MYACLYTKQKTQKRKVWQDGRLVVRGSVAHLHRAVPVVGSGDPQLDACEVVPHASLAPGLLLEMEGHLVTVDGAWTGSASEAAAAAAAAPASGGVLAATAPTTAAPSILQTKVLPKFRKPPARPPPPPQPPSVVPPQLVNRKRPLQPGELQQQYYGLREGSAPYGPQSTHPPALGEASFEASFESRAQGSGATQPRPPVVGPPSAASGAALEHPRYRRHSPPHCQPPSQRPHTSIPPPPPASLQQSAAPFDPSHRRRPAHSSGAASHDAGAADQGGGGSRRNLASQAFATSNGFDPSRFYGDEEEDEEDGDDHDLFRGNEAPWAESQLGGNGPTPIVAPNHVPPQNDFQQAGIPMPVARKDEAASFSAPLSEDQLLDLFGVLPTTSAPSVVSTPPSSSPRGSERRDASAVVPASKSTQSQAARTTLKSGADAYDFTLPDDDDDEASSSSSD